MPRRSKNKGLSPNANVFVPGATFVSPSTSTSTSSPPLKGFVRASATERPASSPEMSALDDSSISSSSKDSTPAVLERFQMTWPPSTPLALTTSHIMGPPSASCPLLDTSYQIAHLIDTICALPSSPLNGEGFPKLFIDLEGTNLSREGTVSLMQICIQPDQPLAYPQDARAAGPSGYGWAGEDTHNQKGQPEEGEEDWPSSPSPLTVYILDMHRLSALAFTTFGLLNPTISLKHILENPLIPKVFFDVRNDSNALFWIYGVRLGGVHDLQCMEAAMGMRGWIVGLGRCVGVLHLPEHKRRGGEEFLETALDNDEFHAVQGISERGKFAFAPEHGGSYEVFKVRPLSMSMLAYAISDVVLMPGIYARFRSMLDRWGRECGSMQGSKVGEYMWNVLNVSRHRVWLSQQEDYEPRGKNKTLNPWMTAISHNRELDGRGHDFKDGIEWVYFQQVALERKEKGVKRLREEVGMVVAKDAQLEEAMEVEPGFAGQLEEVDRRRRDDRKGGERGMRGGGLSAPEEGW